MSVNHEMYERAYNRLLERYKSNPEDAKAAIKKLMFLGVKRIITRHEPALITQELADLYFQQIQVIIGAMALLIPKEFIQLFPITKDYNGHKYQSKDYFYTMDYVNKLPRNEPIGENINEFLWKYMNNDITEFMVKSMQAVSNLRRLEGLPSLSEQWTADNGIKTYSMHTDHKCNQFLIDRETGKTMRVKPRRHLHVVKCKK